MQSIKFSVLIPVYNVEKYLTECIESVLTQSYKNFEIILLNDGSTDLSGDICNHYSKIDERIQVIHQENKGLIFTRRKLMHLSSGDYCLFLDSDDYWENNLLEVIYNKIIEFNCDLIIFKYKRFLDSKESFVEQHASFFNNSLFDFNRKELILKQMIKTYELNNLACKAVKRSIIDIDTDYSQYEKVRNGDDLLQSLPIIEKAHLILYLDKALYNYRITERSVTQSLNVNFAKDVTIVRGEVLSYLKKMKIDSAENLKEFYLFYLRMIIKYIRNLISNQININEKYTIFNEIKGYDLFNDSLIYGNLNNLSLSEYIIIQLFIKNKYSQLEQICRVAEYVNRKKKSILKKGRIDNEK